MSRTAIYIGVNYDWAFYVVGGDLHHDVLLHHPDGAVSAGRHAAGVHRRHHLLPQTRLRQTRQSTGTGRCCTCP